MNDSEPPNLPDPFQPSKPAPIPPPPVREPVAYVGTPAANTPPPILPPGMPEPVAEPDVAIEPAAEALAPTDHSFAFAASVDRIERIRDQVGRVFLGQPEVVGQVLAALLAGGHVLLEGKPGLGKTHLVLALANTFAGRFGRIQFTPDLMPTDVTGHTLFDMGSQTFRMRKGPVFTQLLLADEINRAPAKTQSSLLEVMQEQQVTIDGESISLEPPFMVFATQNPIEQEGTYPLPEAQLDRFLLKVLIDYPEPASEADIVTGVTGGAGGGLLRADQVEAVCSPADILQAQADTASIRTEAAVVEYAVSLVRATRETPGIALGAGTRGAISLVFMAKANALLARRSYIIPDDIKQAVVPVLRHRVLLAPELAISGRQIDDVLEEIAASVEAPRQ